MPARPPPAGKSTLTTQLVNHFRGAGLTVGIIAVDPTSPFTGGALLGDRIRMESVALDPGVFIRSMGSRGSLGGLATTTREVADVLDAAGFDRILVETVGVGQSELDVARMTDSTVLVLVPESGDGIGALKMRREIELALDLRAGKALRNIPAHHGALKGAAKAAAEPVEGWRPPVLEA